MPNKSPGTTTLPFCTGANSCPRPVKNETNKGPEGGVSFKVRVDCFPGEGEEKDSEGKALTGSLGLVSGQEVMNAAASVKTWLRPRGTSNDPLHPGPLFTADAIHDAWRASVARIDAAVVKTDLEVMN